MTEPNNVQQEQEQFLSDPQLRDVRATFTVDVHVFRGLSNTARLTKYRKVEEQLNQFNDVCRGEVDAPHIKHYQRVISGEEGGENRVDYVIVVSARKYMLGFALASEETVEYDGPTRSLLAEPSNRNEFDTDKALKLHLICARARSGIGEQLVRISEIIARRRRCASIYLDSVPNAYGFYKKMNLMPFRGVEMACSSGYDDTDAEKFERAIHTMAASLGTEEIEPSLFKKLEKKYKTFVKGRDSTPEEATVLDGVLYSQLIPKINVYSWVDTKPKRDKLKIELGKIAISVFRINNDKIETIPMSKCLLTTKRKADQMSSDDSDSDNSCHSGDTQIDPGCVVQANSARGSDSPVYLRTVPGSADAGANVNSDAPSDY